MTYDFHTHNPHLSPGAGIFSLDAATIMDAGFVPAAGMHYSAAIHPWWLTTMSDVEVKAMVERIDYLLDLPQFVMVGECGIDRVWAKRAADNGDFPSDNSDSPPDNGDFLSERSDFPSDNGSSSSYNIKSQAEILARQAEVFRQMVVLSERHGKPLTIHCVRAFDLVLQYKNLWRPTQQWTVHGFRGKAALARQLLDAGIDLSFGKHYDPEAFALTPPDRRHTESDEMPDATTHT